MHACTRGWLAGSLAARLDLALNVNGLLHSFSKDVETAGVEWATAFAKWHRQLGDNQQSATSSEGSTEEVGATPVENADDDSILPSLSRAASFVSNDATSAAEASTPSTAAAAAADEVGEPDRRAVAEKNMSLMKFMQFPSSVDESRSLGTIAPTAHRLDVRVWRSSPFGRLGGQFERIPGILTGLGTKPTVHAFDPEYVFALLRPSCREHVCLFGRGTHAAPLDTLRCERRVGLEEEDDHRQSSSSTNGKTDDSWFDDEVALLADELAEDLGMGLQARVLITRAVPGLPLSDCGLRAGDIVVAVDGEPILSVPQLISILISNGQRNMNFTVVRTLRQPTAAELTAHRQYLVETFRQVRVHVRPLACGTRHVLFCVGCVWVS